MKALQPFEGLAKAICYRSGFRLAKATSFDQLRTFFSQTVPRTTNHRLIRLGPPNDGGYLVPDDLEGITACFSPGVSWVAGFEKDMADRGIRCFLADYSVESPPLKHPLFVFEKKYIGTSNCNVFMMLSDWVFRNAPLESEMLLQMDIEGAEYKVLLDTPDDLLRKFRIITIEFHLLDALFDPMGFGLISLVFEKLLRSFEIVHIHPNNCWHPIRYGPFEVSQWTEFTFLRKDRIGSSHPTAHFPHELDMANLSDRADYPLSKCWYSP
jgi:hypothetical protein